MKLVAIYPEGAAITRTSDITDRWRYSGFGGYGPRGPFDRLLGTLYARRNGSYLDLAVRMPGEREPLRLSLLQDELRDLLAEREGEPFGGHGIQAELRVETDVDPYFARKEMELEK